MMTSSEVSEILDLAPLEGEGGLSRQVWATDDGSAIYFLMTPEDFSALHRLNGPEIWHHYSGSPVQMVLLEPDGRIRRPVLGDDLEAGERPMIVVEPGIWMGAFPLGSWALVGATMAPPFDPDEFELGDRAELVDAYPTASDDVVRLTRVEGP